MTSMYFRAAIFVSVLSTQVTGYSVVMLPEQMEWEENQRETENLRYLKDARNMLCCWL